ncbi:hypothetical protein J2W98_002723 [Paenibacillus peoriae]|uniref:DUF1036 domain-containing protein n=1 Tax=Paenibacillus peoriae TaxID=59893 RepID=A0ABU1QFL6_9BACL|nr:hypothetical protein [Paenibacillus peoriae]
MTTMGLNFRNSTNAAIFVVFAYPDFSCTPVNYSKAGWYRVNPGQTIQVWSGFAGGNTFFYYAEDDFGREWRGTYFTQVPENAFNWCWDTGCTTCRSVGLRRIAVSPFVLDYTINFVTSSSQRKPASSTLRMTLPSKATQEKPILRRVPTTPKRLKQGKTLLQKRIAHKKRTK